jgi:hypothetical protein
MSAVALATDTSERGSEFLNVATLTGSSSRVRSSGGNATGWWTACITSWMKPPSAPSSVRSPEHSQVMPPGPVSIGPFPPSQPGAESRSQTRSGAPLPSRPKKRSVATMAGPSQAGGSRLSVSAWRRRAGSPSVQSASKRATNAARADSQAANASADQLLRAEASPSSRVSNGRRARSSLAPSERWKTVRRRAAAAISSALSGPVCSSHASA